jgi:hypothetical protein
MATQKMTLLQIVQDILNDMSSDQVNTISDTVEAAQVAQIVKTTYLFLMNQLDRPHLGTLLQLEAGTPTYPTRMKMPEDVSRILWIKYNMQESGATDKDIRTVEYKKPEDFIDLLYRRSSSASNVTVVTEPNSTAPLLIHNDRSPSYWTSFDDEYIWMDAYDSDVETNLQASKVLCHGIQEATWSSTDTFVPDLPSHMFPQFLAEAKATCMVRLKQTQDPKSEKQARDAKTRNQYSQWRSGKPKDGLPGPNFGRK